jgi:CRP-like cAMP-binding protein
MDEEGALGKEYRDGEIICRQGERGDRMYVIHSGQATVVREDGGLDVVVGELKKGDIFGEMAIFDRQPRSATVRAKGTARVLTLDKRAFMRQVHEDPSLAYRILEGMSRRIRKLDEELSRDRHLQPTGAPSPERSSP